MGEPDERGGGRARRAVQGGAAEPVRDAGAGGRVLARRAARVDGGARRHGAVQAVGCGEAVRDVGRECGDAPPEKRAGGRGQGPDGDLVGHADAAVEEVQVCLVRSWSGCVMLTDITACFQGRHDRPGRILC